MGRKHKLRELGAENDIQYCEPLSYQGFQWLGWLCISLTAALFMLNIAGGFSLAVQTKTATARTVPDYISTLSLPFLLIANFAKILNHTGGYKSLLVLAIALEGARLGARLCGRHADRMTVQSLIDTLQRYIPGGGRLQ